MYVPGGQFSGSTCPQKLIEMSWALRDDPGVRRCSKPSTLGERLNRQIEGLVGRVFGLL